MAVEFVEQFSTWVSETQDAEQRKFEKMKVRNRKLKRTFPLHH